MLIRDSLGDNLISFLNLNHQVVAQNISDVSMFPDPFKSLEILLLELTAKITK